MDVIATIQEMRHHLNLIDVECLTQLPSKTSIDIRLDHLSLEFSAQINNFSSVIRHHDKLVKSGKDTQLDYASAYTALDTMIAQFEKYGLLFVTALEYGVFNRSMFNAILEFAKYKFYSELIIIPEYVRDELMKNIQTDTPQNRVLLKMLVSKYDDFDQLVDENKDLLCTLFNPEMIPYVQAMYYLIETSLQYLSTNGMVDISSPSTFDAQIPKYVNEPTMLVIISNLLRTAMGTIKQLQRRKDMVNDIQDVLANVPASPTLH